MSDMDDGFEDEGFWQDDEGEEVPTEYANYLKELGPKEASTEEGEADGVYMMTADEAKKVLQQKKELEEKKKNTPQKYLIKKTPQATDINNNAVVEMKKAAAAHESSNVESQVFSSTFDVEPQAASNAFDMLNNALANAARMAGPPSQTQEIQGLIAIRDYINVMINNYNRDKKDLADLRSMLILVDNKIVSMLLSEEFKNYVDFANAKSAMIKAHENNTASLKRPRP